MTVAVNLVLLLLATALAGVGAYLGALTAVGLATRPRAPRGSASRRRFAVLIPAHDEATVIARLLASLRDQTYPAQRVDVFVVADNCTDATARIARHGGAIVYLRDDPTLRAKGHALRWLLERVREYGRYDAYVIFDADSVASRTFLARMAARLEAGSLAVQANYRVLNATASPLSALREAAFASIHYLRPLGRARLGLSCGLKGNGMCFDAATLDRVGWQSFGLAEDVELHFALLRAGVRVDFAPEATVRAEMPTTLRDAGSQNLRWEAGRLSAARGDALALLWSGLLRRRPILVDAAIEQLIPPLSVALAAALGLALVAALAGAAPAAGLAIVAALAIGAHVVAGLVAVRASPATYLALGIAPVYIAWKVAIYARALVAPAGLAWVRTKRLPGIDARTR